VSALINRDTFKDENGNYQEAIADNETVLKLEKHNQKKKKR
jgi:hypothetical protein